MNKRSLAAILVALSLSSAAAVFAAEPATQPAKPYPFTKCMISGEALGGDMGAPVVLVHEGQEVKFCCGSCEAKFKKDPSKYMKEMADAGKNPTTTPSN